MLLIQSYSVVNIIQRNLILSSYYFDFGQFIFYHKIILIQKECPKDNAHRPLYVRNKVEIPDFVNGADWKQASFIRADDPPGVITLRKD